MTNKWTTNNVPNLSGKVIIVTGANSGIGFEATREFAKKGAETILACRNSEKAERAANKIKKTIPDANTVVMQLDLASLRSVKTFVDEFKATYNKLDILLNNAGIMFVPYQTTEDEFESQVGINHLGHFALTGLLYDLIVNTPKARVVNVASNAHRFGDLDFENFPHHDKNGYSRLKAYGTSKLANLLFTYELDRRFKEAKLEALAVAAHPGVSNTNLIRQWYIKIFKPFMFLFTQSARMGALPTLRASVDSDVKGGEYYGPSGGLRGHPVKVASSATSHNENDAKKLWEVSEELTGVSFPI